MSQSSTHSSLLHQNRPASLQPLQPSSSQCSRLEKHEARRHQQRRESSNSSETREIDSLHTFTSQPFNPMAGPCHASTSQLPKVEVTPSTGAIIPSAPSSRRPSLSSDSGRASFSTTDCAALDGLVQQLNSSMVSNDKFVGEAISRDRWQPDTESIFCTSRFCTITFSPKFTLGPRRHHCRLCGLLTCSTHSSKTANMIFTSPTGRRSIRKARICDSCDASCSGTSTPEESRRPSFSSSNSETVDSGSGSSGGEFILTPTDELSMSSSLSSSALYFAAKTSIKPSPIISKPAQLAPLEDWMDRSGVLSLYPLAVNPSHRATKAKHPHHPAVGPLFAPSREAMRKTQEKARRQLSIHQRRKLGREGLYLDLRGEEGDDEDEVESGCGVERKPSGVELHEQRLLEFSHW